MSVDRVVMSVDARTLHDGTLSSGCWVVRDRADADIIVKGGERIDLVIVDTPRLERQRIAIKAEEKAVLNIVQVVSEGYDHAVEISMAERAEVNMTQLVVAGAKVKSLAHLQGGGARFTLNGSFVHTDDERGDVTVDVKHEVGDCVSRTAYRGVASGKAQGRFSGLVYIAQDAQRTDAEQLSRNVTIGDAVIHTAPQMEIYADDVKCSHGATVGQMDAEAIMYMRQRGISAADAKRLQIQGFVADTILHAAIAGCGEPMMELLMDKLERL